MVCKGRGIRGKKMKGKGAEERWESDLSGWRKFVVKDDSAFAKGKKDNIKRRGRQ